MSSIDERVVKMNFDNAEFEKGVRTSLNSLDALNKGLKLEGATKGIDDVSSAISKFSLGSIASGVDGIADKFKALSIIGITALANIVTKALSVGSQLLSSLTVDPVKAGLSEYETNLNSIQTILSNTAWQHTGLNQVNDALNQLNHYSDLTIYNFSEMARNIGTFTAAGVGLQTSVDAIKGIANLAAISGSSSEQASTAMYQLSQALATGTVKLMDWNSVVNAGMGGKVFQDALMETARVHGVAVDQIVKDEGSFRDSLQKGWLTSQILTETLQKFTGDLTASQLKAMGYNDKQIAGILALGKNAQDAATKIKTFSQLISTLQESVGSGWAQTWQLIFGDFDEAKIMFTNVYNVLGGFISASAKARNSVLSDWKELGGRTAIINAISNTFTALIAVVTPIKDAFREIFPATTGKQLADLSKALESFTEKLKIGGTTADELKRTFAGVFAVLGIGWDIIKAVVSTLLDLVGVATKGSGGFLKFTASIGDFLVNLHDAEQRGQGIVDLIKAIGNVLAVPIKLVQTMAMAIGTMFGNFDSDKATNGIVNFASKLDIVTAGLNAIASGGDKLNNFIAHLMDNIPSLIQNVENFVSNFANWISDAFSGVSWDNVLSTINTGLFGGLVVLLKMFIDKFKKSGSEGLGLKDIIESVTGPFEQMTKTLATMQNTLRAATLLEIAAAISLLTISAVALSKIDNAGLTAALTAMTVMFTQLFLSMAIFNRVGGTKGFLKMPIIAASFILLATAVDILTIAVSSLSKLSWEELSKGLIGVSVILGSLALYTKFAETGKGGILAGAGLILMATAINILTIAVGKFGQLSWEAIAKGLIAMDIALGSIGVALDAIPPTAPLAAAGVLITALSLAKIADALKQMGQFSWGEILKGLLTMDIALGSIGSALEVIPPTAPLAAAGVFIVALSLKDIANVLDQMGSMSWGAIGKSLVELLGALTIITLALDVIPPYAPLSAAGIYLTALALIPITDVLEHMGKMSWGAIGKSMVELLGALTIIGIATTLMILALPGAAALLVITASLAVLTPILIAMGNMSWGEIGKGLLTLAGVFIILGAAGILLGPVVPILIGLGVAVTLLGAGMLLAGAGVLAFSIGLTALSVAGAAGAAAIVGIVTALIGLIPQVMTEIGLGIVAFAQVIATAGPAITAAITTVLLALITAIATLTPKIVEALYTLLEKLLETMANHVPHMVDAGLRLLIGVLTGIANNIGRVVSTATDVVVNFVNGISANIGRVIDAGVKMIISFVNGLADAIRNNTSAMRQAGLNLAGAIIDGMTGGLYSGVGKVIQAAKNVAKSALDAALSFLGIKSPSKEFMKVGRYSVEGLAEGLDKYSSLASSSATNVGRSALESIRESINGLSNVVSGEMNMEPIVTPVLDLTDLKKNAGQINKILSGSVPISINISSSQASDAAAGYQNNLPKPGEPGSAGGNTFNYTQNNTSPKALSSAEIYRQTNNQLSKVKEVVAP